jgi:hypothetical protein
MRPPRLFALCSAAALLAALSARFAAGDGASDKKDKVNDSVELKGAWFYDDLPGATAQAKKDGKPLLLVFR